MASKIVFKFLIFLSVVMSSFSYIYIIPGEMGKSKGTMWNILMTRRINKKLNETIIFLIDHDDHCFYNDTQSLIKRGESVILKTCEEVSCGDDYSMTISGFEAQQLNAN